MSFELRKAVPTDAQLAKLFMGLARGSRLQGFAVKTSCLVFSSYAFHFAISLLRRVEGTRHRSMSVWIVGLRHGTYWLVVSEPVVWMWLIVVSLFAAFRMYQVPLPDPGRSHRDPR
jgi:hypothetical protein